MSVFTQLEDLYKRKVLRRGRDRWNHQYAAGRWDNLADLNELARFSVIAGYSQHLKPSGSILEVGAGPGVLVQRFDKTKYGKYLVTDLSDVAVKAAEAELADEKTFFAVADMNTYVPTEKFDVIIINEAIYYAPSVQSVLDRFAPFLNSGGIFIVSINDDGGRNAKWHVEMDACSYQKIDQTTVSTNKNTFVISVLGT